MRWLSLGSGHVGCQNVGIIKEGLKSLEKRITNIYSGKNSQQG